MACGDQLASPNSLNPIHRLTYQPYTLVNKVRGATSFIATEAKANVKAQCPLGGLLMAVRENQQQYVNGNEKMGL